MEMRHTATVTPMPTPIPTEKLGNDGSLLFDMGLPIEG